MKGVEIRDLIVVLPGIMGSSLQQHGHDAWGTSTGALWNLARSWGGSFKRIALNSDPLDVLDLDDGIVANSLITMPFLLAGMCGSDGYQQLIDRLRGYFAICDFEQMGGNFFTFPYDWRRDNRVSARRLMSFVDDRLLAWQRRSQDPSAKVIFLSHSMGGLVARHYLEVLGGWEKCRALISFGTPYRGSAQALSYLANGCRFPTLDLTEVVRSFTSMYQLLPIYECIRCDDDGFKRIVEVQGLPGIDPHKAIAALAFHREIEAAVEQNRRNARYHTDGYKIVPFVGIQQPTNYGAELDGNSLTMFKSMPHNDMIMEGGDGTVPRYSATPIELGNDLRETFLPERHAFLQSNTNLLTDLLYRIEQSQIDTQAFRGPGIQQDVGSRPSIRLRLPDIIFTGEPLTVDVELLNVEGSRTPSVTISDASSGAYVTQLFLQCVGSKCHGSITGLPAGLYRMTVGVGRSGPKDPPTVSDLVEILDPINA